MLLVSRVLMSSMAQGKAAAVAVALFLLVIIVVPSQVVSSNSSSLCLQESGNLKDGCIAIQVSWKSSIAYLCPGSEEERYKMRDCAIPTIPENHPRGAFAVYTAWGCGQGICKSKSSAAVYREPWITTEKCRPAPYNRTECTEIKDEPSNYSSPRCTRYWCGNGDISDCRPKGVHKVEHGYAIYFHELKEHNLPAPPKNPDGSNCVTFKDSYSCDSAVHMCKDQEKPGRCHLPSELDINNFSVDGLRLCVGDFSCPGRQKCCKHRPGFTEGYCMEPYNGV